jgi:hypothetical protein
MGEPDYKKLVDVLHAMVEHIQTQMVPAVEGDQSKINKLVKTIDLVKKSLDKSIADLLFMDKKYAKAVPDAMSPPGSKRRREDRPPEPGFQPLELVDDSPVVPPAPKKAGRKTRRRINRKPKH